MGLAILPGRLKTEFQKLALALSKNMDIRNDEMLKKHADWVEELKDRHGSFTGKDEDGIVEILKQETGIVFSKVLEHAGVYKTNRQGLEAFKRFLSVL